MKRSWFVLALMLYPLHIYTQQVETHLRVDENNVGIIATYHVMSSKEQGLISTYIDYFLNVCLPPVCNYKGNVISYIVAHLLDSAKFVIIRMYVDTNQKEDMFFEGISLDPAVPYLSKKTLSPREAERIAKGLTQVAQARFCQENRPKNVYLIQQVLPAGVRDDVTFMTPLNSDPVGAQRGVKAFIDICFAVAFKAHMSY